MAKYEYTAEDKDGKHKSGVIEATDKKAALKRLGQEKLKPIIIKEQKSGFDPNDIRIPFLQRNHVKGKDLVIFTRQLSTMINAGVPLVKALASLQQQTSSRYLGEVLEDVTKDVEGGMAFADALEKHPKAFSRVYIHMVRAGEAGGILDDILKRLAYQEEKSATIRKKVKSAMTYPIILITLTVSAFLGLMIFIVPKIGDIIKDLAGDDAELPGLTQLMLSISDFIVNQWYIFFPVVILLSWLLRRYIKSPKGRVRFHTLLLKTPVIKTVIIKVAVARFARTFSSLMSAGVGVLDSINITKETVGNAVIDKELEDAAAEVRNGKQLSEPLSESKVFPIVVSQMLAIGEETGNVDEILVKIADFYEEEVDAVIDGISSIIEPVMIVIIGAMVGVIAYSVLGPITSLSQQI